MSIQKINIRNITRESFRDAFNNDGFVLVEDVFPPALIEEIGPELQHAIRMEAPYHKDEKEDGLLLACPIYGGKFLEVLENKNYLEPFNWILGDTCIIWVYTTSCMPPGRGNHASRVHVDRPHFVPDFNEGMGSLIFLSDFTEDNGATWILPGSHRSAEEPGEEYFYKHADRVIARKGSVFYFNLRLWHAGGENKTKEWRNALGIGMIRPYFKQRIDLPRAMASVDISRLSDMAKQKLGFFSQPPSSLDEFYKNAEKKVLQPSEWDKPVGG